MALVARGGDRSGGAQGYCIDGAVERAAKLGGVHGVRPAGGFACGVSIVYRAAVAGGGHAVSGVVARGRVHGVGGVHYQRVGQVDHGSAGGGADAVNSLVTAGVIHILGEVGRAGSVVAVHAIEIGAGNEARLYAHRVLGGDYVREVGVNRLHPGSARISRAMAVEAGELVTRRPLALPLQRRKEAVAPYQACAGNDRAAAERMALGAVDRLRRSVPRTCHVRQKGGYGAKKNRA